MENRYKIIISNYNLYKEIELAPDMQQIKVGTGVDCDVRLRKDYFFGGVELFFLKRGNVWSVLCSDNVYLTTGDVRKLMKKDLAHGESLLVKYQESDNDVFTIDFLIDFNDGKTRYEREIDISDHSQVSIGYENNNNIVLRSPYVKKDAIALVKKGNDLVLLIRDTTYGVYHNGRKARNNEIIKNRDFLSVADFFFYYKKGRLWTEIRDDLLISGLDYEDNPTPENYPKFNRNTRVKTVVCDEKIEILDPPAKPQKPKNNLLMRLLPSCGMLIASGVMAFMGGGMIVFSIISAVMAIITSVVGLLEGNKEYKKQSADRLEKYTNYINKKKVEIEQCRQQEYNEMEEIYIPQKEEQARFVSFSSDLFDRTSTDEDFLCVRLGSGAVESKREINYKKQEKLEVEDELQEMPEQIYTNYKYIQGAPIVCDFKAVNAVGVVGLEKYRFEVFKNMIVDIAARQYFSEVGMALVAKKENKSRVHWLRMLPHLYSEQINSRMMVVDDESKNLIFEYLYKELTVREQSKSYERNLIVFFYDDYGFENHPISKFIDKAQELGVTFVFFGDKKADIPVGCSYIIDLKDEKNGNLICAEDKSKSSEFTYPQISDRQVEEIVKILAPVYTEEISLEGTLTKNISMFEMLNILAVDDLDLSQRWACSQVFKSMAAPLGVSKTGIVSLDLHDKAHGPHGLVAGTTGSGKSEILQTYILAMSTLFHPYEVGFVIIDFKGGGMVNQFKELPHLLGAITNIDGKEINRSLKSIKAELQKRQRLFAEADVNHIDKYIKKFKAGEVKTALPHLIIIVDEFAELKAEQPEFMKELISAARIGRSLGVHLILATQKPSGQVNEQIWSNSRFKLCLKVQSQEDSNEVLKSPLAAEIKEPGRAYLQVGNNEIFELFQSAYSGAPEKTDTSNVKEFAIYNITDSGKKVPVYKQTKTKNGSDSITQLEAVVNYVKNYCDDKCIEKLSNICLPSLPLKIPFEENSNDAGMGVCIGKYDAPEMQYQGGVFTDLSESNLLVVGSSQTGKTNLLQVLIRSLAQQYSPSEVNFYIADFGTMILRNFEGLKHCGGVVCANDTEKTKNLFKMLNEEIGKRKQILADSGVSSFVSYKEAGNRDMPLIVLLIDNISLLRELYFMETDYLLPICREGLSVGISIVATNSQASGIGYKYLANFNNKIALYCNDSSDYNALMGSAKLKPDNEPGRCIIEIDKELYEAQVYLAFEGEKEYQRIEKIKAFITEINSKHYVGAKKIPVIPEFLTSDYMQKTYETKQNNACMGLSFDNISPVYIDFTKITTLGIVSKIGNELKSILNCIINTAINVSGDIYLMDNMESVLKEYSELSQVKAYSKNAEKYKETMNGIFEVIKNRYDIVSNSDNQNLEYEQMVYVITYGHDFIDVISSDRASLEQFKLLTSKYKSLKICFVFLGIQNMRIPMMGADVLKTVRDNNNFLFLDDLKNLKVIDVSPSVMRKYREERQEYDAYLLINNDLQKIKIARNIIKNM